MPNAWINALKEWNRGQKTWCIPKTGSQGMTEVKKIMEGKPVKVKPENRRPKKFTFDPKQSKLSFTPIK